MSDTPVEPTNDEPTSDTNYNICGQSVSSATLKTYKTNITQIIDTVTNQVLIQLNNGGNNVDLSAIANAIAALETTQQQIQETKEQIAQCFNYYKNSRNGLETDDPETMRTAHIMEGDTKVTHTEIIYYRIEIIVYIGLLAYFFYLLYKMQ